MIETERVRSWFVPAAVGIAAATAAYAAALTVLPEPVDKSFSALALVAAMLAPVPVLFWRARREQGRLRRAWLLLAGSALAGALVFVVWSYYQLVHGESAPIPSLADVFFMAAVLLAIPAMLYMPGSPVRVADRLRTVLDGLIVAASFTLVSWATVLGPAFRSTPEGVVETVLLLGYPMGDVVSLIVAALVVMRAPAAARVTIGLIAAGVASLAVGDSVFTYLILRDHDPTGGLATVGWFAGYLLMALAALWSPAATSEQQQAAVRRTTVQGALFPTIAAVLGLAVGFLSEPGPFIVIGGVVLIVLVLTRQLLALGAENRYAAVLEQRVEQRTAEILAQESRWRALVQNSSDAILVTDAKGIIRYESPAVERILGYGSEERLGAQRVDFIHPDDVEGVRRHLADLEASPPGSVSTAEFRQRHADGSWRWVEASKTNLLHVAEVGGVVSNYRDVTERKGMEAELGAARDQALEASRLKSEFLANMSHEIRTPMNGVIGLTGLLLGTDLDSRQRQYAEGVQGAAETLLDVINDILDFSKIEAGKLEVEVVDFDLRQVVEEAADLLAGPAQRKGLELVAYCDPQLPGALRGDPGRLRQVLINLVSNAVKFTERGEVVVRVRPGDGVAAPADCITAHFEVLDTGIGIDTAQTQRLFEPFAQADASTTRRYGGTGLGLAISAELVAAMGGQLHVDSRPGEGSRFWFTLALERQPEGSAAPPTYPQRLQGLRVLIVDDNETNRLILCEQLRAWQLRPDAVGDGPAALDLLREAAVRGVPYELALLDLCMQPMDGIELARRIRSDPQLGASRLILLSSAAADVDASAAASAGLAARLTKPVRQSHLYDALVRVMSPAPETAPTTPTASTPRVGPVRAHVLVVEDNVTNQMVARGVLEELNYTADVAANGIEALEALEANDYAAVLMDCQMPEMDGFQATAEIRRRQEGGKRVPIIAMTAAAMEGDRERCLAAGMDDYVSKPVEPRQLEAALERWAAEAGRTDDPPPLDPARLEMLRGIGRDDGAVLRRVAQGFVAQAPADLDALDAAVAGRDIAAVVRVAHRLRGAAANLGATTMAELSGEIEGLARADKLNGAPALLGLLRAELARTSDALAVAVAEHRI